MAAIERIKTALTRAGHADRIGEPTTMGELAARGVVLGGPLPPSYVAAVRAASRVGEPEQFLQASEMRAALAELSDNKGVPETPRFMPFARVGDSWLCFDTDTESPDGELSIAEWVNGAPRPLQRNFGEWLDSVADTREESLETAAVIPARLRMLLLDLGFRFDYPVVGRLETGDVEAIEELLGPLLKREVRGEADRLFDASGKASLTLNVDEFTLACSLRTGIFVFEAEDVFRWLRYFRDENFFGESHKDPAHPDNVRDLRKAQRESPQVMRGVSEVATLAARTHSFRAASGKSANDFYLLGRTSSTSESSPSLILHVKKGNVQAAHAVDEPLNDLYVMPDGTMWGLSLSGSAICFSEGSLTTFPLERPGRGRTWWYGIGGDGDRVLVWGAGALLEFDGEGFVPFEPDAALDEAESVAALSAYGREIAMLVCGDRVGAVARFDGKRWLPIAESHVVEGVLADLDLWRGVAIVLARDGRVWRIEDGPPRPVIWDSRHQAFVGESGTPRPTHAVRGYDGGALLASDGGVIAVGSGEPVFHAAGTCREATRLARVGGTGSLTLRQGTAGGSLTEVGVVAMCGPHAWVWTKGAFQVLDLREW